MERFIKHLVLINMLLTFESFGENPEHMTVLDSLLQNNHPLGETKDSPFDYKRNRDKSLSLILSDNLSPQDRRKFNRKARRKRTDKDGFFYNSNSKHRSYRSHSQLKKMKYKNPKQEKLVYVFSEFEQKNETSSFNSNIFTMKNENELEAYTKCLFNNSSMDNGSTNLSDFELLPHYEKKNKLHCHSVNQKTCNKIKNIVRKINSSIETIKQCVKFYEEEEKWWEDQKLLTNENKSILKDELEDFSNIFPRPDLIDPTFVTDAILKKIKKKTANNDQIKTKTYPHDGLKKKSMSNTEKIYELLMMDKMCGEVDKLFPKT